METSVQKKRKPVSTWLLFTQTGMVVCLVLIGCFDITTQFSAVFAGCVGLAFLSATQDIAVDGLSCCLLSKKERAWATQSRLPAAWWATCWGAWLLTGPCTTLRVYGAAGLYFLSRGALFALMNTLMMDRASLKSPATDFTLQYSVSSFAMLLAAISGAALAGRTSYLAVMSGACIIACVAMAVSIYAAPPESGKNFSTTRKEGI